MNITNHIKTKFWTRSFLWSDNAILVYLALVKLLIHLLFSTGYGYFGDELYWLAMTKHLDFGYVDVPPLVVYLAALSRALVGDSLFAIHILPAIAGAIMVYFAGLATRELGGGRFAQWFAALTVLVAPFFLWVNSVFTYDPFDQLCSVIFFYLMARIINRETPKKWLLLGIIAGLGVMTKLSMLYTIGALVLSLLLTSWRKSFLTVWPWLAALITALICSPYLVWQSVHGWPLLSYFHSYAQNPLRAHPQPIEFIKDLISFLNPVLFPVWLLGLFYLLFHPEGKKYRIFGFNFLILAVFYTSLIKLEPRQIVSACFPLLSAGAIWLERMLAASAVKCKSISWLKRVYIGAILVSSVLIAPIFLPILPVPVLEKYLSATPAFISKSISNIQSKLPFQFSFRLGWPEIVKEVAAVYYSLPETDREKCAIWGGWYWDAGAIDLFGKNYGLPDAISNCQSYQIWGEERFKTGKVPEVAIMLVTVPKFPGYYYFDKVIPAKSFKLDGNSIYGQGYLYIFICREPKANFQEAWKENVFYF